jgi:hypothetical protein
MSTSSLFPCHIAVIEQGYIKNVFIIYFVIRTLIFQITVHMIYQISH